MNSKHLWEGCIPVHFVLSDSDLTSLIPPLPMFAMIPRMSYFVLSVPNVIQYFTPFAIPILNNSNSIWFEYNAQPLKWNIPLGVMFDILKVDTHDLPWTITVHFQNKPNMLLPITGEVEVESHFMNSIKQATYAKYGTVMPIMNLKQDMQRQLWNGVKKNDFEVYAKAYDCLEVDGMVRNIPIRLYTVYEEMPIQKPVVHDESKCIRELIESLMPEGFCFDENKWNIVVQGISIDGSDIVDRIYKELRHPDGFLYIVLLQE